MARPEQSTLCPGLTGSAMVRVLRSGGGWFRRTRHRQLVQHLLAGCDRCARRIRSELLPSGSPKALGAATGPEHAKFERYLGRLESMERPAQELFINGVAGLHTPQFVAWMVELCRTTANTEPERAVEMAKLAVIASEGLDVNTRALARMRMGQVLRRARGDFLGADTWFDEAREMLSGEDANSLLLAKLNRLQGLSRWGQSRSEEALRFFDEAACIYEAVGDIQGLGKTCVDRAGALDETEGPQAAIRSLIKACGLVDLAEDPRLAFVIAQNLSIYHAELGKTESALSFLELARDLLGKQKSAPADSLRMDWSAGRILAQAGQASESVSVFRGVRDGFAKLGLAAEAGQASLDLALSLLNLGRIGELKEVAQEMLPIFRSRLLHKEALAAVEFFREAVAAETITAAQIHAVSAFLSELEADSRARFRQPV